MNLSLKQHSKWEHSTQVWYNKYHTCIDLGPFARYNSISLRGLPGDYRERQRHTSRGVIMSVYTSDDHTIQEIIDRFPNRINKIRSPINETHLEALQKDGVLVEIRHALYYGKYKFKIHTLKKYSHGFDREMWNTKCAETNAWIKENFKDSRTQRPSSWTYAYFGMTYSDVTHLYTNDEMSLMLYKMAYGDTFHIEITQAFTPEDFASV